MRKESIRFVVIVILGFYLPVILIWVGFIPFEYRFHVLVLMAVLMAIYSILTKHSCKELGFRVDTLKGSLIWNGGLSLFIVVLLVGLYLANLIREPTIPSWTWFFVFYVFISSPSQEFIFRSVMFAELERAGINKPIFQILFSSFTFSFLHVIYNDWITLGVGFLMGIIWGVIYRKYPNFWGITISHAILGAVSIAVGLI